jgi:hypothetical protein
MTSYISALSIDHHLTINGIKHLHNWSAIRPMDLTHLGEDWSHSAVFLYEKRRDSRGSLSRQTRRREHQ